MEEGGKKLAMPVGDDSFWFSRTNAMALMLGLAAGVAILAGRLPPLPQNSPITNLLTRGAGWEYPISGM